MTVSEIPYFETAATPQERASSDVVDYYRDAGPDYAAWSTQFNMHFGLATSLGDFLSRERMLNNMNAAVISRLQLGDEPTMVVDLGCGLGATMRWAAPRYPRTWFVGATIVDWQVAQAREWNQRCGAADRIEVFRVDYTRTGLPSRSADGVYALESACHDIGGGKRGIVQEAARLLRPGATFAVADGFRTDRGAALSGLTAIAYRALCRHWAISELADLDTFVAELRLAGFVDIVVEDISWTVAPSVMHVPWVTLKFLWRSWRDGDRIHGWRRSNVLASLLTMFLGLCRSAFSYCIVTARAAGPTDRTDAPGTSETGPRNTYILGPATRPFGAMPDPSE